MLLRWGSLAATAAIIATAAATVAPSFVNQTTCNGKTFTYQELAGYAEYANDARDMFGDTIGGIGSAIALDRRQWKKLGDGSYTGVLWSMPGRGWNTEGTIFYQPRIHKFAIKFNARPGATIASPSGPNLVLQYQTSILLYGPDGITPCTGLDADGSGHLSYRGFPDLPVTTYAGDNFGGPKKSTKLIPISGQGLVLNKDGSFYVSDEYGPYVYYFDNSGKMIGAIRPPDAYIPKRNGAQSFSSDTPPLGSTSGDDVIPANPVTGRANNQGFEGLTTAADGNLLYVFMQSALNQEGGVSQATKRYTRLLKYDISKPASPQFVREVVVPLPLYVDPSSNRMKVAAQFEILHIQDGKFFVLARDSGLGYPDFNLQSVYRHADIIDTYPATDIKGSTYDCATCAVASAAGVLKTGITLTTYCPFLDFNVNSQLKRFGLMNGAAADSLHPEKALSEKWSSLAVAPVDGGKGDDDEWFLFSVNDNGFITQNGFINFGSQPYQDPSGFNVDNRALVFKIKLPDHSNAFT